MPELLYTVKDVAKLLKTNEDYVRKLIKKGYLKAMVLGRLKVRASALEEFLAKYEGYDVTDVDNIKKDGNRRVEGCSVPPARQIGVPQVLLTSNSYGRHITNQSCVPRRRHRDKFVARRKEEN